MKLLFPKRLRMRRYLSQLLALFLALPPMAGSQVLSPEVKPGAQGQTIQNLKVVPLAGNRENNDLERRMMAPLVVQVLDQDKRPVEGAAVVFQFPSSGPGATFANQQNSKTFRTNADGQAAAVGWVANNQAGTFQVKVSASRGNEVGETTISMTNVTRVMGDRKEKPGHWWSSKWAKIGIIAVAAGTATAIILATRGSGSSSTSTPGPVIIASPGAPTIGGPQ
jgi:hypothetical protein